ncbi:putative nuclease HARBI1 [Diabrotica virgifera virgifera]|uniref:Putative nuclease HARBI1 n=1 Tax=Diabrotica virgifera virgifera TaxID=50390 RepID=A0ABM5L547_DIAVI|nr:putative nuclease HARBI1 [Diabrotica virgifera virgifera]
MMNLSSSDEDLEEIVGLLNVPKNANFFEETVQQFNDQQFIQHFRLSRDLAVDLANKYERSHFHYQKGDSEKISPLKVIVTFLWFSSNEAAGYRDVSDRFGISISSLHKIVTNVTYFLSNMSRDVIKWPTNEEKVEIERHFRQKEFPGVIGIIDGTHIKINKPQEDPDSYLNRKHFYSIQAQVVCDNKKKIRDIFVGYPGSVHDSRVFRTSTLFDSLEEKCGEYFIIGDSGYPCLRHCLTPFQDRGNLTRRQRNYNYLLSKNRYLIEHCFGLLKQKFRQLYHLQMRNIDIATHFIRAMCVLHNISVDDNLELLEQVEQEEAPVIQEVNNEPQDERDGVMRRNEIMNSLRFQI